MWDGKESETPKWPGVPAGSWVVKEVLCMTHPNEDCYYVYFGINWK